MKYNFSPSAVRHSDVHTQHKLEWKTKWRYFIPSIPHIHNSHLACVVILRRKLLLSGPCRRRWLSFCFCGGCTNKTWKLKTTAKFFHPSPRIVQTLTKSHIIIFSSQIEATYFMDVISVRCLGICPTLLFIETNVEFGFHAANNI